MHHRRWIWTVQYNSALTLLPQASIAKILSTLTKVRQTEGFSYAHSKNGIQTMMLELPMSINGDDGSRVSCVVQYVIFPPHSSSGSCTMSTWSDEDQNSEKSGKSSKSRNARNLDVLQNLKETMNFLHHLFMGISPDFGQVLVNAKILSKLLP